MKHDNHNKNPSGAVTGLRTPPYHMVNACQPNTRHIGVKLHAIMLAREILTVTTTSPPGLKNRNTVASGSDEPTAFLETCTGPLKVKQTV